jgi:hypothetical protein
LIEEKDIIIQEKHLVIKEKEEAISKLQHENVLLKERNVLLHQQLMKLQNNIHGNEDPGFIFNKLNFIGQNIWKLSPLLIVVPIYFFMMKK